MAGEKAVLQAGAEAVRAGAEAAPVLGLQTAPTYVHCLPIDPTPLGPTAAPAPHSSAPITAVLRDPLLRRGQSLPDWTGTLMTYESVARRGLASYSPCELTHCACILPRFHTAGRCPRA